MSEEIVCGGFRVGNKIGSGAQGFVCEALCVDGVVLAVDGVSRSIPPGTSVALKITKITLPDDQPQFEDDRAWHRLSRRIAGLMKLAHPGIVRYYGAFSEIVDLGGVDGRCRVHVVVMELLHGSTLEARLRRSSHGLDAGEALSVAKFAAAGLAYACRHGVVHRDIKPANIFVCDDGSVRIIDFGLAAQENATRTVEAGGFKGTLNYMAPDFVNADDFGGDETSDIFSFGVTLHELLTGKLPYKNLFGDSGEESMAAWFARWTAVKNGEASPVSVYTVIDKTLKSMSEIVTKALAIPREERYGSFADISRELEKVSYVELHHGSRTYRYLKRIGEGGCGEVYKALDLQTNEVVAVKRLSNLSYAERFEREAQTMQRLQDRDGCFVRLVDYFTLDDGSLAANAFLVMEFLDGMPGNALDEAIAVAAKRSETLDRLAVLLVFERYARGLAIMHAQGIVHRDIKPGNLYYADGRPEVAKIIDYGIVLDEANPTMYPGGAAVAGSVPCTLEYAPPEVVLTPSVRGSKAMDIYALGLSLYEALSGKRAFPPLPKGMVPRFTAFFARVHKGMQPSFDGVDAVHDAKLLELLRDMTATDVNARIADAEVVALRLRELVHAYQEKANGPKTALNDATVAFSRTDAERIWRQYHPERPPDPEPPEPTIADWNQVRRAWIRRMVLCGAAVTLLLSSLAGGAVALLLRRPSAPPPAPVVVRGFVRLPPDLPPEVTCYFDETLLAEPSLEVDLGRHDCRYAREGFVDQTFSVRLTPERREVTLPGPDSNGWCVAAVEMALPAGLPADVSCRFRDEVVRGSFPVAPGRHEVVYGRPLCRDQKVAFVADRATRRLELPPPGEWEYLEVEVKLPEALPADVSCVFCGETLRGGARISPGDYKCLYRRAGYRDQEKAFSVGSRNRSFTLPSPDEWAASPVEVRVPQLDAGVSCRLAGRLVASGTSVELPPGRHDWAYERDHHRPQSGVMAIAVGDGPKSLPPPVAWQAEPVVVLVPQLASDIVCTVGGERRAGGETFRTLPGDYEWEYSKLGCFSQKGKITVKLGKPCQLPPPGADWTLKPIKVTVPPLDPNVSCYLDSRLCVGAMLLLPDTHEAVYLQTGCVPQTNVFSLAIGDADFTLPKPKAWVRLPSAARPQEIEEAAVRFEYAKESESDEDWAAVPPLFVAGIEKRYVLTAEEKAMSFTAMNRWNRDLSAKEADNRLARELGREPVWSADNLSKQRVSFNTCAKKLGWKPGRRR